MKNNSQLAAKQLVGYLQGHPIYGLWCLFSLGCANTAEDNKEGYSMHRPELKEGIFYVRPIYAPLSEVHVNAYVMKKRTDLATNITEFVSFGKDTNYDYIKLGKWLVYNADHTLQVEEYYDDKGSLIKKVK